MKNRTVKFLKFAMQMQVMVSTTILASNVRADDGGLSGGGGDGCAIQFAIDAKQVLQEIQKNRPLRNMIGAENIDKMKLNLMGGGDSNKSLKGYAINSTTNEISETVNGKKIIFDAYTNRETKTILLSRDSFCKKPMSPEKSRLIAHELLVSIGLESTGRFPFSSELLSNSDEKKENIADGVCSQNFKIAGSKLLELIATNHDLRYKISNHLSKLQQTVQQANILVRDLKDDSTQTVNNGVNNIILSKTLWCNKLGQLSNQVNTLVIILHEYLNLTGLESEGDFSISEILLDINNLNLKEFFLSLVETRTEFKESARSSCGWFGGVGKELTKNTRTKALNECKKTNDLCEIDYESEILTNENKCSFSTTVIGIRSSHPQDFSIAWYNITTPNSYVSVDSSYFTMNEAYRICRTDKKVVAASQLAFETCNQMGGLKCNQRIEIIQLDPYEQAGIGTKGHFMCRVKVDAYGIFFTSRIRVETK